MIDEILWLLKDGKWHNSEEIIETCSSPKSEVEMGVSFLREYDFIQVDENGRKVKLRPLMRNFIDEIQRVERGETLSQRERILLGNLKNEMREIKQRTDKEKNP